MTREPGWLAALAVMALVGCADGSPEPERGRTETEQAPAAQGDATLRPERSTPVAITIDDLPWVGPLPPGWTRATGTDRILAALRDHGVTATGFVNCGRVAEGAPVLGQWLAAGHLLGNHTQQHLDLNYADTTAWAADAVECDRFLRRLTDERPLLFRYPYLHRGPTAERYAAGRRVVEELGETIAPVTINTGDWILDDSYVAAMRASDDPAVEVITEAYVEHIVRAADHYREVAEERVGRDVAHILLLHANALLAEELDAVLAALVQAGFRFVPLDAALRDPVYSLDDDYIGPEGLSWLYRIPPAVPSAQQWDADEAARLRDLVR